MKSEATIQNEIRLALSEYGIVLRLNSGKFWQGDVLYDPRYQQNILINLRPVNGCPEGTSDLMLLRDNGQASFIECKNAKGKAREKQSKFIKAVNSMGYPAGLARSVEEAVKIIER